MMRALLLLSAVAATSVAATLNAQVATTKPDSTCTNYPDGRVECKIVRGSGRGDSEFGNRMFFRMDSAMAKRAALGLELRATGTRRDTLGVFVEAVTPKGPAENAGIIEGDRIAAINGVDLRTANRDIDDEYANGLAAHRLGREVQKLTPGNRVTLRVFSGGRFRDVQVTAGKASDLIRLGGHFNIGIPGPGGMMEFNGPGGGDVMFGPEMMGGWRCRWCASRSSRTACRARFRFAIRSALERWRRRARGGSSSRRGGVSGRDQGSGCESSSGCAIRLKTACCGRNCLTSSPLLSCQRLSID